jgi:hypothetical protein
MVSSMQNAIKGNVVLQMEQETILSTSTSFAFLMSEMKLFLCASKPFLQSHKSCILTLRKNGSLTLICDHNSDDPGEPSKDFKLSFKLCAAWKDAHLF